MTDSEAKKVVLVVEDEPILRMSAVDMVEEAGFEVLEAANATQAMELIESRGDIRVILTDIEMPPGIDGMKLVALARARRPPIEIILVSGHIDLPDVRMPERGMFFTKPYRPEEIVEALKRMVG